LLIGLVSAVLSDLGFEVVSVGDGRAAVEAFRAEPSFVLPILDGDMPNLCGIDAARAVFDPLARCVRRGRERRAPDRGCGGRGECALRGEGRTEFIKALRESCAAAFTRAERTRR